MSKFEQNEYTLPAYWASYLINGDHSGMDDKELEQCQAWEANIAARGEHVTGCSDEQWFAYYNDATQFGGDVMTFTTLREVKD